MLKGFSVETNVRQFTAGVRDIDRNQIPFAVALALTKTAQGGQTFTKREMERRLDKPTRFTLSGVAIKRATKRDLVSEVFFRQIQAAYMSWQADGGVRYPSRRAIPVPVGVRLNKFGNMPRRKLEQLRGRRDVFSGTVRGVPGLWQRMARGQVKLLVAYEPQARYRPRFPMERLLDGYVSRSFDDQLAAAFAAAVDGAR